MEVTLSGMMMEVREVQPEALTDDGDVVAVVRVREVQPENALLPMLVTLSGMVREVRSCSCRM